MTKKCKRCQQVKDSSEFSKRVKNEKVGLQAHCKTCNKKYRKSHKEQERAYRKKYRKLNPLKERNKSLKYSYGIDIAEYERMFNNQNGCCLICGSQGNPLVVDHNHSCCPGSRSCSECIRGLLCRNCNLGIGYFKDNNKYLKNAIEYLKRFSK